MKPFYLTLGDHRIAAIFEEAKAPVTDTCILLVPPFGWDDQTAYRPRRDWSLKLSERGFSNLRIDFPGTGNSSGSQYDDGLVEAWTKSVAAGIDWLKRAGALRVGVIALGAGGLVALQAIAQGCEVDDLVLWGMPLNGKTLVREFKAFSRFERAQTGEPETDGEEGGLRAGGHVLTNSTIASLLELDALELVKTTTLKRALLCGRDGSGPDQALVDALRCQGSDVQTNPGRGWGVALARAQSASPFELIEEVNDWLGLKANPGQELKLPRCSRTAELGAGGARVRETPILFEGAGQSLFAILSEPLDMPSPKGTIILFNAGAIRRIGPNRMWTEAARDWAARGLAVVRVDLEGIGDAGGEGTQYERDESFYTQNLIEQSRCALDLATRNGLPQKFVLGGLCSGGFWAFQLALSDPRVRAVIALNPRMLLFDPAIEGVRELKRFRNVFTAKGLRKLVRKKGQWRRFMRLAAFLLKSPARMVGKRRQRPCDPLLDGIRDMQLLGQHLDIGFSSEEPLYDEWKREEKIAKLEALGTKFHDLPLMSHTLKPLAAQRAARSMLDQCVERVFP